jgi:hypothetical protein
MRSMLMLLMLAALLVSTAEAAERGLVRCGWNHYVRSNNEGGFEVNTSSVVFRNLDLHHPLTIERLTVFNLYGAVVHDSGPAIGVPHPLNTDLVPAQDITVVPPGAGFYLGSTHIWGNNSIPGDGGNQQGISLTVAVEFSKAGMIDLGKIAANRRVRRLLIGGPVAVQGEELSSLQQSCYDNKGR